MQKRVPVKAEDRSPLPAFTPVPRKCNRHDGWTPERQRAFIEALADTGSVSRAARQVNMAQANCYTLRRAPGAESFRAAWEAALDFGVQRLKDIAFERAIDGELIPVFVGGRLMGYRRKRNDALLMFCLRHYGQDANGKRTTINYFSTRASAGAGAGAGAGGDGRDAAGAVAEAATTTVRTTLTEGGGGVSAARIEEAAERIEGFAGVTLDPQAQAEIGAALAACAARKRALDAAIDNGGTARREAEAGDPATDYVEADPSGLDWRGALEPPVMLEEWKPFVPGEDPWERIGSEVTEWVPVAASDAGSAADGLADPAPRKRVRKRTG
ncbi:LysR family transcriptional regulator [Sphingomonas sp. ST-64]|uniref:LysR family transcriptional regulator n=1 Tax=Sphingomonas plantiphila TaxID=3163295 RepID=A0ABW8YNI7_9SPHN